MASVSVSHLILFIASMLIAASVAGVFTSSVDELAGAIDDRGVQVSENVRTSIEIISDGGSDNIYDDGDETVTLLVKNVGTNELTVSDTQIDVLINGRFQAASDLSLDLLGDGQTWSPNEVVRITANQSLASGDHRAKVIVNDAEAVFEFRVEVT
jgi:flagellar protein FlaG